ncbi:MAG: FAD-binding oxidoreductase [Alphaproteobacteria bacterium]|nr:FAD-binding oxidoreductase [Alphaproteobacteria bacterium]MDD9919660.1 FAD-binding oxidoreductase [Alphaproteobacteria bacterium]
MKFSKQKQSGWGQVYTVEANVWRPERSKDISQALAQKDGAVIAQGLARSYGDASLQPNGMFSTKRLNKLLAFDEKTGELTAQAGVTISEILAIFLHRGWMPAVMPGTRFVTLGGCVASDVHGKDCANGSFGRWVTKLVIHTAQEGRVVCSPTEREDLFKATIGGMGLTGIIEEVTVKLQPVKSSAVDVQCLMFKNVQEGIRLFREHKGKQTYMAAWIDGTAKGTSLGRGWLQLADEAKEPVLQKFYPEKEVRLAGKLFNLGATLVPSILLNFALNWVTLKILNAYFYHSARWGWQGRTEIPTFMFPLDKYPDWYRMYGKRGFYQFQCVIPDEKVEQVIPSLLRQASLAGGGSFFTTLKLFEHGGNAGVLSFPMEGMTLAMDFPRKGEKIDALVQSMADEVVKAGGKVYLTKDALLTKKQFQKMYPQAEDFFKIKKKYDPQRKFWSDLAERVMG